MSVRRPASPRSRTNVYVSRDLRLGPYRETPNTLLPEEPISNSSMVTPGAGYCANLFNGLAPELPAVMCRTSAQRAIGRTPRKLPGVQHRLARSRAGSGPAV